MANTTWHIESRDPTQAKGRLEWGTHRWLPVWQELGKNGLIGNPALVAGLAENTKARLVLNRLQEFSAG